MSDCIFCKIARGEMDTDLLYEDDRAVAFRDIDPQAPVHVLIIPREHFISVEEMEDENLIGHLIAVGSRVAGELGVKSHRLVLNTGRDAGQAVFHVHLHLLAGRSMGWPPG